ncbi:MAG: glycosyltransferase family 2 protein [Hassallia sp.]
MNVINRIQFPRTPETSSLYMKCDEGVSLNLSTEHAEVVLTKNGVLSLNTYFNSFFEKFYAKYTELSSLDYLLKLEGDFQVSLFREQYGKENRELILTENCINCQPLEPVKISIPDSWKSEDAGRLYLEITCLSDRGLFTEGFIATEQPKVREVSLGIISCTFKKEVYIKKTVETILKDDFLQKEKFKIFVVDNGKTLKQDEFDDPRVQLIPNRNVGGSGGFTRGLIQALQEDVYTHFLFMDDDIELESETVYRLFPLYEYANQDFAISGSMLDLYKKHILYEAGALYAKELDIDGNYRYNPFKNAPLKYKLNLENSTGINRLLLEEHPDYGGFWFFSFSKKTIETIGLLMPFFIKVDDIEFGLRIKEHLGDVIVAFPGIAVWHEPFYAKYPVWDAYYEIRNRLIAYSIRGTLGYIDVVKFLTKDLLYKLLAFDYNCAEMMIDGFEAYLQGPEFINSNDPEVLHSQLLKDCKKHKSQTIQSNTQVINKLPPKKTSIGKFNKMIAMLTVNGHLLPNFLISNDIELLSIRPDYVDPWYKSFAKKRSLVFREGDNSICENKMNQAVGIGILIRWLQIIIKTSFRWSSIRSKWKNAFNDFTSTEFWKDYLKLS